MTITGENASTSNQAVSVRDNRKRLSPQAYRLTFAFISKLQDGKCAEDPSHPIEEIDHINGDPSDNRAENLRGLCKSCNVRLQGLPSKMATSVSESVTVDVSAEIEISRDAEPRYRRWLFERTGKKEPLYTQEAIYGGAEIVGISPVTARRYLGKVTSPQGVYFVVTVKANNRTLKQVIPK